MSAHTNTIDTTVPENVRKTIVSLCGTVPASLIWVHVATQRMHVWIDGEKESEYVVSTSKYGVGNREGSFQTPVGIHKVMSKIGSGAEPGTIFKDRINTEKVWTPEVPDEKNLVLSRILRLEGLEEGVNKGEGIDSFDRYIYIHGTNHEESIGTPISHGCVCMKNSDIVELFDKIPEGIIVAVS